MQPKKEQPVILNMVNIGKSFGSVQVLKGVDFAVQKGEIRALVGANGAGKSTLMKIISGAYRQTSGAFYINGKEMAFQNTLQAYENGVGIIYQELSLVNTMSVFENVFLNREIMKNGLLDKKAMLKEYEKLSHSLGFHIPGKQKVATLSIANQQMVEIMKVISMNSEIIIMDEPTTSLTDVEKVKLFEIIKRLKDMGKTIIYISHILREIFQISDQITIMRDGEIVGSYPTGAITQREVASLVANQSLAEHTAVAAKDFSRAPVMLDICRLQKAGTLHDISFQVKKGEILGIAGLVGAGRSELFSAILGDLPVDSGEVVLDGEKLKRLSPTHTVKKGIGLVPEDRKHHGLILRHAAYKNATLMGIHKLLKAGFVSRKKQLAYTESSIRKLRVKINDPMEKVSVLSGGNQQKIVLAKLLGTDLKVIMFDEPTKGIDIGAKGDIMDVIREYAAAGVSVIFVSSDLEEVIGISDRVLVMSGGRIVKECLSDEYDLNNIMSYAMSAVETEASAIE